jgi:hypothetical protein
VNCSTTLAEENQHIIMVIDYFTKWVEAIPTVKSDGKVVSFFIFDQIIAKFGILSEIFINHGIKF